MSKIRRSNQIHFCGVISGNSTFGSGWSPASRCNIATFERRCCPGLYLPAVDVGVTGAGRAEHLGRTPDGHWPRLRGHRPQISLGC